MGILIILICKQTDDVRRFAKMNRIISKIVSGTYKKSLPSWKNRNAINSSMRNKVELNKNEVFVSRSINIYSWESQCKNSEKDYANDPEVKEWLNEISADFEKELNGEGKKSNVQVNQNETYDAIKSEVNEIQSKKVQERKIPTVVNPWSQFTSTKFSKLDSSSSKVIYDFNEEQLRREAGIEDEVIEPPEKIVLQRGITGVYDFEELIDLLREENAKEIV